MIGDRPLSKPLHMRPPRSPERTIVAGLDVGAAAVTGTLIALTALGVTGVGRTLLALVFVTFVPGWAVLDHLAMAASGSSRIALAVALSLTISVLATFALLRLHLWYPVALLDVLGGVSLAGVMLHLIRPDRPTVPGLDRLTAAPGSELR